MTTNDRDKDRVAGPLRPAFDDPKTPPASKHPGSDVFGRMPRPDPSAPDPPAPRAPVQLPSVRRKRRVAGVVIPAVVALAGSASAYILLDTTHSLPIALVCAGVGLVGAVFCYILLRDEVEVR